MKFAFLFGLGMFCAACTATEGTPIDASKLGFQPCEGYFDCGPGRFCNPDGYCWADCRTNADCAVSDPTTLCNPYGQCLHPEGGEDCASHADCDPGHYCNGVCSTSGAHCGGGEPCPYGDIETCAGICSSNCGSDNDCLSGVAGLSCTPVGQCLESGWENWVSPGELPPTECTFDAQCRVLGWQWVCDCEKTLDAFSGYQVCARGKSACVKDENPLDFGGGPASSPAHAFRGVWGMRMDSAVIMVGVPLINRQNSYSSNLFLVKLTHTGGDTLRFETKICEIKLINFNDDDTPPANLAWMLVPERYLHALPTLAQEATVPSANPGDPFETTRMTELRGCVLADPVNDPLPTRLEFEQNPKDARFWDQDGDGSVAITTLIDGVLRGEIYNIQRWSAIYHGQILDADHIRGLNSIDSIQLVISASTPALVYDVETQRHPQEDRTYHRMVRMADDTSCAALIREGNRNDSWLRHTNHMMDVPDPR